MQFVSVLYIFLYFYLYFNVKIYFFHKKSRHTNIPAIFITKTKKNFKYKKSSITELKDWCRLRDLNPRPAHYEWDALPTELNRHCKIF